MAVEEAARVAVALDRARLRAGRELRGRTQTALAGDAGVSPAAIGQFEKGLSRPTPTTLARIAAALDLPVAYFERRPGAPGDAPAAFFRSLRSTSAADRNRSAALVGLVRDLTLAVEEHVRLPAVAPLPSGHAGTPRQIEAAAADARDALGLPPHDPVPDVVRALERNGVITARLTVGASTLDAFSVPYPDRPVVVLGADKGQRDRSRFDAAHELGHLVLHTPDDAGTRDAETQAHQFAAAFLMPADAIRDDLPARIDWDVLFALKQHWQVSIAALLKRASTLGKIDAHTYTQAMKAVSARGWRTREPVHLGPPERPALLAEALRVAEAHGITLDDLAAQHGLPAAELRAIVLSDAKPVVTI
jgi:Zn-dependent peptidase ImmA (M78 family)/transcriptional regulator with XRE-family HTH domain